MAARASGSGSFICFRPALTCCRVWVASWGTVIRWTGVVGLLGPLHTFIPPILRVPPLLGAAIGASDPLYGAESPAGTTGFLGCWEVPFGGGFENNLSKNPFFGAGLEAGPAGVALGLGGVPGGLIDAQYCPALPGAPANVWNCAPGPRYCAAFALAQGLGPIEPIPYPLPTLFPPEYE